MIRINKGLIHVLCIPVRNTNGQLPAGHLISTLICMALLHVFSLVTALDILLTQAEL